VVLRKGGDRDTIIHMEPKAIGGIIEKYNIFEIPVSNNPKIFEVKTLINMNAVVPA
jgi:hypothetical protein